MGCGLSPKLLKPDVPADLTAPCPDLLAPTSNKVWDFVAYTAGVVSQYNDCSERQKALAAAVK